MALVTHMCAVCGERMGADARDGIWFKAQPRADGAFRCRTCHELSTLFAAALQRRTDAESEEAQRYHS